MKALIRKHEMSEATDMILHGMGGGTQEIMAQLQNVILKGNDTKHVSEALNNFKD